MRKGIDPYPSAKSVAEVFDWFSFLNRRYHWRGYRVWRRRSEPSSITQQFLPRILRVAADAEWIDLCSSVKSVVKVWFSFW